MLKKARVKKPKLSDQIVKYVAGEANNGRIYRCCKSLDAQLR